MRFTKKAIYWLIILAGCILAGSGCGSELATGTAAGAAAGFFGSETVKGMESDLERTEQVLIDLYNQGVEAGEKKETLDELEKQIRFTQYAKAGVKQGKEFIGIDWTDPSETGHAVGELFGLGLAIIFGRKLNQVTKKYKAHKRGAENFMRTSNDSNAEQLYKDIGAERVKLKV